MTRHLQPVLDQLVGTAPAQAAGPDQGAYGLPVQARPAVTPLNARPLLRAALSLAADAFSTADAPAVRVAVVAADPVLAAGVASQLAGVPGLAAAVVHPDLAGGTDVAVVVGDAVTEAFAQRVRGLRASGPCRVVVVLAQVDDTALLVLVEAGACGVLRRSEASRERLEQVVRAAHDGDGSLPPDLLGRLLEQVQMVQRQVLAPRGLSFSALSGREIEVLRLVSDGMDTREIAKVLCYSERTVKNVIHDVTTKLGVRNRSAAVAHAVRAGLI